MEQVEWGRITAVETTLSFRVVVFSSGYQLQRLGAKQEVVGVRPASFEEYLMFKMLCEVKAEDNDVEA